MRRHQRGLNDIQITDKVSKLTHIHQSLADSNIRWTLVRTIRTIQTDSDTYMDMDKTQIVKLRQILKRINIKSLDNDSNLDGNIDIKNPLLVLDRKWKSLSSENCTEGVNKFWTFIFQKFYEAVCVFRIEFSKKSTERQLTKIHSGWDKRRYYTRRWIYDLEVQGFNPIFEHMDYF